MAEEKVYFANSDRLKLCGILETPKKETEKCVILCHGLSVDKDEEGIFVDLSHELVERDFAVFRFDFRGHGESEGKSMDMTPLGEVSDVTAAVGYVQKQGFSQIAGLGASFGAAPLVLYAGKHPILFKAIILWNGRVEYQSLLVPESTSSQSARKYWGPKTIEAAEKNGFAKVGENRFKVGKALFDEMKRLNPWQELDRIQSPILFIHSTGDTVMDYHVTEKYAKMFDIPLVLIEGAEHGFHDNYKHELEATHATIDFLQKHMS